MMISEWVQISASCITGPKSVKTPPVLSTYELLKKYDVPGPRYTSYPTVPVWKQSVGPADYAKSLSAICPDEPLSLYFHIPFCEQLCHFCGCLQVITRDKSRSRRYVAVLVKEIDTVIGRFNKASGRPSLPPVSQIHLGGGTPNFLQPAELTQLMQKIRATFNVLPDAEIAIEMHPRTSTRAFCDTLKKEGFNRISLGVQDFDDKVQRLIHRFQTFEMTQDMLSYLRSLGFKNFNFDLIYGLPGQTPKKFAGTLEKTLTLSPDRLAVYSYAHVPWARPVQRSFKDSDIPSPQDKLELFIAAINFFMEHGYRLIGMDHFAKDTDELAIAHQNKTIHRNFMGYSTRADSHQIGFGVSAISYVNGNYFQNTKNIKEYESAGGQLTTRRGFLLTADDRIRRALINQLMCHLEIDIPKFEKRHRVNFKSYFSKELKRLAPFIQDELLHRQNGHLKVTPRGHLVIRNIAMCFDRYLDKIKKTAQNPVFSRTV